MRPGERISLEQGEFMQRVSEQDQHIISIVKTELLQVKQTTKPVGGGAAVPPAAAPEVSCAMCSFSLL